MCMSPDLFLLHCRVQSTTLFQRGSIEYHPDGKLQPDPEIRGWDDPHHEMIDLADHILHLLSTPPGASLGLVYLTSQSPRDWSKVFRTAAAVYTLIYMYIKCCAGWFVSDCLLPVTTC